jgi:hypothetical protein
VTTDGFAAYPDAIAYSLGTRADYAQLIKIHAAPEPNKHRYSPSKVIEAMPMPRFGNPDAEKICASHVERQNLNIRMAMRRFTLLTNAFSKKWENLKAALAFYFAYYNFCRIHSTIRCTPAMEAGISNHVWELKDFSGLRQSKATASVGVTAASPHNSLPPVKRSVRQWERKRLVPLCAPTVKLLYVAFVRS